MARNVRLPNGVVIQNVPDNVTKEQVRQKAIQTGRARPEDFQQSQAQLPAPEMMARDQRASGQTVSQTQPPQTQQRQLPAGMEPAAETAFAGFPDGSEPNESVFKLARERAENAGVDPRSSAPVEVRIALALSSPIATTPEKQLSVAQNAFGEDATVRIGPETGELEYQPKGADQWSLVNPPGFDFRDLAAAAPETAVLGSGMLAGLTGGTASAALTAGNPPATYAGGIVSMAAGEAQAQRILLEFAREKGYLPEVTDEEINREVYERGKNALLWGAGGTAITAAARQIIARYAGYSPKVVDALSKTDNIDEAIEQSSDFQRGVERASGEQFPMTSGQVFDSPEMRVAESAAARRGLPERNPITQRQEQQRVAQEALEEATFGRPISQEESARLANKFVEQAEADVTRLSNATSEALDPLISRSAKTPEQAATIARGQIELGIRDLYKNDFAPRYEAIFSDAATTRVSLSGLNEAARKIESKYGQDILSSISLTNERVLKEAKNAGLRMQDTLVLRPDNLLEWQQKLVREDVTLKELQNTLVDLRREIRRPGIDDEPRKKAILTELKTSLEVARNRALSPEKRAQLKRVDEQYREASDRYNESFIAEFVQLSPDGTPIIRSQDSFNRILRNPDLAETFIDSMNALPNGDSALSQFRRGTVSYILEEATENGEISQAALNKFLTGPNRRALTSLFQGDEIAEEFDTVSSAAKALQERQRRLSAGSAYINNLLGEEFIDPAKIAQQTYANIDTITPKQVVAARNFLPEAERGVFDRAFATQIRNSLVDVNGNIDSRKVRDFLESPDSFAVSSAREVFGEDFIANLQLLQRSAELRRPVTRSTAGRDIDRTLASVFDSATGSAEGLMRFARVPLPPLSVRGRAFTASLGQLQTRTQRQLASALANPEKIKPLRRLLNTNIYSKNFENLATRIGLASFVELRDAVIEATERVESVEEAEAGR